MTHLLRSRGPHPTLPRRRSDDPAVSTRSNEVDSVLPAGRWRPPRHRYPNTVRPRPRPGGSPGAQLGYCRYRRDASWEADPARWWRVVETNLRGPYLVSRGPARPPRAGRPNRQHHRNRRARGCRLLVVLRGERGPGRPTESLAQPGVLAFDVSPGLIRTDLTASMPTSRDAPAEAHGFGLIEF